MLEAGGYRAAQTRGQGDETACERNAEPNGHVGVRPSKTMEEAAMTFYDRARDRDPYYPTSSRPSGAFDGTGIVLLLAVAIVVALIMMSDPGGDGRVGVTNTASPTFKTPPPPSESTSPAEPTPKPATEPNPNPTKEPRPTQAPIQ